MSDLEFYTLDDAEHMMAGYEASGLAPVTFGSLGVGGTKSQSFAMREGSFEEIFGEGRPTAAGVSVSLKSAMAVGAFFACARVVAEDVAKLPLHLREYVTNPDGSVTTRWVEDHDLVRLMREPNEYMTAQDFIEIMLASAIMTGEAYARKIVVDGRIEEVWPLLPGQCVFRDDIWSTEKEARYDIYDDLGFVETVAASELVRLRGFGLDLFKGADVVRQAREAIAAQAALVRAQGKLYGKGQRPSGLLTTEEPLDKRPMASAPQSPAMVNPHGANQNAVTMTRPGVAMSAHDRVRTQWNKAYSDSGEGGVAVLDQGWKFVPIDVTNADADTLKVWEALVAEVCRVMRVSPVKVMQAAGSVSYNSLEQTNYNHLTDTLESWLIRLELGFGRDLLSYKERHGVDRRETSRSDRGPRRLVRYAWFFDREEYLRPLPGAMMEMDVKAIQTGIMTRNEVRERRDLPRFEDADNPGANRADSLFAPLPTNPGGNPSTTRAPAADPKKPATDDTEDQKP